MAIKFSNSFLMRKLHQVTGIVPLGIFFLFHIYTNSAALNGAKVFNDHVEDLHEMPYLLLVEIFGVFIPLMFHAVYGMLISSEAKVNVFNYRFARNWFYVLQRISGVYLFFFLLFHILNFRFGLIPGLNMTPVAGNAQQAYAIIAKEFAIWWVLVLYILGLLATAWHLAYGVFLFAVDWGIVIGVKAQKILLYGCLGFGLILAFVGINSAFAFKRPCGFMPAELCQDSAERSPAEKAPTPRMPVQKGP